jgi:hypothetical protein
MVLDIAAKFSAYSRFSLITKFAEVLKTNTKSTPAFFFKWVQTKHEFFLKFVYNYFTKK